jgi:hypothetical protein
MPTLNRLSGRCLCGAVEFTLPDDLAYAGYCHCSDCRRFSGSAFSAFGGIDEARFSIVRGAELISHYPKTADTVLGFCSVCGSSLYAKKPRRQMVHLRLGALDQTPSLRPQAHSYVGSKAEWFAICDGLPQYASSRAAGIPAGGR